MLLHSYVIFGSAALFLCVKNEELSTENVGEILLEYEKYINVTLILDRKDRELLSTWAADFQVKQVNITSHYRLDMTRHREHSFKGKKTNPKWKNCISLHKREIDKSKLSYLNTERECLQTANTADTEKVQAVHQLEKEIRKWRKSYRYLSNLCSNNNPDDQDAASLCLVEYVKRDSFDDALKRLIILKLKALDDVLLQLNEALADLEECLKINFANFLTALRNTMGTLNTCYNRINKTSGEVNEP